MGDYLGQFSQAVTDNGLIPATHGQTQRDKEGARNLHEGTNVHVTPLGEKKTNLYKRSNLWLLMRRRAS